MADYLLHESPVGYSIFSVKIQADAIGSRLKELQETTGDLDKFGKMVELVSFAPFHGAQEALTEINDISEGIMSDYLKSIIEANLPKAGKKKKIVLGVSERNLGGSIKSGFPYIECETSETSEVVADLLRGLRTHQSKLLKALRPEEMKTAQLGLGHAYSRGKVKFSITKNDNHIIQAIATLDNLDKAVNLFSMRCREMYSWHFPELVKHVSDNLMFAACVVKIGNKNTLSDDSLHDIAAVVGDDESIAQGIIDAARVSMGRDLSEDDMKNVTHFAERCVALSQYRKSLTSYLSSKMNTVAPNLAALIGDTVGARLISKAGSLTNLSKYPASTLQILGAEKALFRALKTKGNTPKYGLIYHSAFIGKAGPKNKGRISRFLANKCSIASRIDNFTEVPTNIWGNKLRQQVEERIEFYASGAAPTKNETAMKDAMDQVLADMSIDDDEDPTAAGAEDVEMADGVTSGAVEQKRREKEKKKKDKKSKKAEPETVTSDTLATESLEKTEKKEKKRKHAEEENGEKKKKKKKSKD